MGLVVLVFLAGLAGGVLGARLVHVGHVAPQMRDHLGAPPLDRYFLHRDLDLSADQREQMRELLGRQRTRFEELHRELRPRVESLMEEIDREVESILTPEQLERYRSRPKHWRRSPRDPRRHGPRRPHGPPHDPEPPSDTPPPV
jgi:Spy/CpxP family protein refolding chaperone